MRKEGGHIQKTSLICLNSHLFQSYIYWASTMLNRSAILIRMKEPAVQWINEADPSPKSHQISIESANEECTIYLVSDEDGDGDIAVENWVKRNYKALFEDELFGWYTDPDLWPSKLTYKMFNEWFEIESHSVLIDTVDGPIFDDEI